MGNINLSPPLKRHKSQMQLIYWKLNPTLASFLILGAPGGGCAGVGLAVRGGKVDRLELYTPSRS